MSITTVTSQLSGSITAPDMTTERQSKRKRMVSESLGVSANLNDSIQKENSIILQLQFTPISNFIE